MPRLSTVKAASLLVLLCVTLSCGGDDGGPRLAANIVIVPNHPVIIQGMTRQLTATVVDASGRAVSNQRVTFSSSDTSIATVSSTGLVTSVGPLGPLTVVAEQQGISQSVDLTIEQRAVELQVFPDSLELNTGEFAVLTVVVLDVAGEAMTPVNLTITSSNPAVVEVSDAALHAVAQSGRATITVSASGMTREIPVTVDLIPSAMQVNTLGVVLGSGQTKQLTVTVSDRLGVEIPAPAVTYTGNAPSVFAVSPTGLITSLGPNGSGRVTVSAGPLSRDVGVYVGPLPSATLLSNASVIGTPYAVAITSTGKTVLSLVGAGQVGIGQLPDQTFPTSVVLNTGRPLGVAVNAAGTLAYVAMPNGVDEIDLATNTVARHVDLPETFSVLLSADGSRLLVGTSFRVYALNTATLDSVGAAEFPQAFDMVRHPSQPLFYAINGGQIAEINQNMQVRVLDVTLGSGRGIAISPDGAEVYGADEYNDLWVVSVTTGKVITQAGTGGCFGVANAGNFIIATCGSFVRYVERVSRVPLQSIDLNANGLLRRPAVYSDGTVIIPNEGGTVAFVK